MIVSGVSALPYDDSAGFTAPPAFGPFRVLHQIGSGALGPVFRAFEPEHERLIAVKAFRLDIVPEVTTQLADALRGVAATRVESVHVVAAAGAGLEGMTAFLASEYATSETFDVALRRIAPATPDRAIPVLRQIAEAIEAAWQAGLGHGALHPRDVFVSVDGDEVRVGGFGVVPALEQLGIKVPARRPYTAPERLTGRAWDIRADVFSLGVLAHELLTGRRPAGAGEQDGALPSGTTPEQRVAIRRALAGVLADDPGHRYATPSAFIAALETGNAPVAADLSAPPAMAPPEPRPAAPPEPPRPAPAPSTPAPPDPPEIRRTVPKPPPPAPPAFASWELRPAPQYVPPPPAPIASGTVIGLVIAALLAGAGIGYWLHGASAPGDVPTALVTDVADVTNVAGTEVPVVETPPPAVPPAAPRATRGRLLVRSEPSGARVIISGRARGTTPATIRDLAFGTYNVTVSRTGYQTKIERVRVSRAAPFRDFTVVLRPAPPVTPAGTTGAVYIETRPAGAQVTIDGRLLGTSPMRVPGLAPGSHTIRLDLAGHKSVTTTVVVRAGQVVPVRVSLELM